MTKRRLFWQLMPTYLVILLGAVCTVSWLAVHYLQDFYLQQTRTDLEARAKLLHSQVLPLLEPLQESELHEICRRHGAVTDTRVTIILPDGRVAGDSMEEPAVMDNHGDRPEIREALRGTTGSAIRYSHTLHQNMFYAAHPLLLGDRVLGVVRAAVPMTRLESALGAIKQRIALSVLVVIALAAGISLVVSRHISRPLVEMTTAAERFARGDFNRRVPIPESRELGRLADSLNWMAAQLDEKTGALERQRNEMEAVFSSMAEGVIAVDRDEQLLHLNRAAAELLGIDLRAAPRRSLQELVRNVEIQGLVSRALGSPEPVEGEITLHQEGRRRQLYARGTALNGARGEPLGALLVLHDITRLNQLEMMRRDFVANVSHEIKTPITSIKGFVETLLDGALDEPQNARRFLGIMARQSDRLAAIVEDLLSLSRIEQEAERGEITRAPGPVNDVLISAVEVCAHKAEEKNIRIECAPGAAVRAEINAPLLEQAVVNLVDNAVKYSPPGTTVRLSVEREGEVVRIRVADEGPGIPPEHHARIFERFYRIDKARSRELGGTGLGLAIVKHIALAHGGSVRVHSDIGRGSVFTIEWPGSQNRKIAPASA